MNKKIIVECTWGDGPDVMVTFKDKPFILYEDPGDKEKWVHGSVRKGSFDLTADEATRLGYKLIGVAETAKMLTISSVG